MANNQMLGGVAIMALGAAQALTPQAAAKAFGMRPLDPQGVWLARLLGCSNLGLGSLSLNPETRAATGTMLDAILAAEAVVTVAATVSGTLPKRTGVMVLGFLGALAAIDVLEAQQS
jgi:hypothetical protein